MIFGVSPTKDAIVIARTTGSGETFVIKTIKSIQFQARSGDDLGELLQRLVVIFDRGGKNRGSTIALLASSSGRFKSSIEAITELAAAESGLPIVRVQARVSKRSLVARRGRSGRPERRNDSIRRAAIRAGRKARLALRLRPSRSLTSLRQRRGIGELILSLAGPTR
jgi:hypothetical protein